MLVKLPEPISIAALHRQFTLGQGEIIDPDTIVSSFTSSSRDVEQGTLFIACRGAGIDGHNFIDSAFEAGATAAVVGDVEKLAGRPGFQASNARRLLSRLSALAFKHPSQEMRVIGVTGTNGKTTTNWMIYHALLALGEPSVRIGTLGYEISGGSHSIDTLTTPSPEDLHRILALALEQGCKNAVIEISSHALHQHRVDDVSFDAAVFTNITHDHLDYHRTFEEYLKAKRRLFELLKTSKKPRRILCSNLDSPEGRAIAREFGNSFELNASFCHAPGQVHTPEEADRAAAGAMVQIKEVVADRTFSHMNFEVAGKELSFKSGFLGSHNAENLAAAIGVLHGLGFALEDIARALSKVPAVPGRLEAFECNGIATFVDFAHSPDALERVLGCLKETPHRRLILVFGCGGNRDWRKRASMGNIAARLADYVVVTSDNPRNEDPQKIIEDIMESSLVAGPDCAVIPDRAEAIQNAMSMAADGDIVLIAGKGHEDYQIIGDEKLHFSDQEQIRKFFGGS